MKEDHFLLLPCLCFFFLQFKPIPFLDDWTRHSPLTQFIQSNYSQFYSKIAFIQPLQSTTNSTIGTTVLSHTQILRSLALPMSNTRSNAADQLDYITTEIVHCDDEFCPDLKDMMMDALLIASEIKEPKLEAELRQCQTTYSQTDPRCDRLFMQCMFFPWAC